MTVWEASGFDGYARLGRTAHKERTHWQAGSWFRKGNDDF